METDRSPTQLFLLVSHAHRRAEHHQLDSNGFKELGQPKILFLLEEYGKGGVIATQREIADRLRVSPSTITASLKSLERLGYVMKISDENDLRIKRVAITEKGREAAVKCREIFEKVDNTMFDGFSAEELEQLSDYFERITENLRTLYPSHSQSQGGKKD